MPLKNWVEAADNLPYINSYLFDELSRMQDNAKNLVFCPKCDSSRISSVPTSTGYHRLCVACGHTGLEKARNPVKPIYIIVRDPFDTSDPTPFSPRKTYDTYEVACKVAESLCEKHGKTFYIAILKAKAELQPQPKTKIVGLI